MALAMLPLVVVGATPAGAAAATTCKSGTGTANFNPTLPKRGSAATVRPVLTTAGKLGGCSGGGVTGATTRFTSVRAQTGMNCSTLETYNTAVITGTETIRWNNNATSTVSLALHKVKGKPTEASLTGTVTGGLFKGTHEAGLLGFSFPAGACSTKGLGSFTYRNLTPIVLSTTAPANHCSDNSTISRTWVSGNPNTGIGPAGSPTDHFYLKILAVCSSHLTGRVQLKRVVSGTSCGAGGDWKIEIRQGTGSTTLVHDRGTGTRTLTYSTAVVGQEYRFRVGNLSTCTVTAYATFTS
jgi:hypothetical protein